MIVSWAGHWPALLLSRTAHHPPPQEPRMELDDQAKEPTHERGASLVEYALLLALIAVVCVVAVTAVGTGLDSSYRESTSSIFVP